MQELERLTEVFAQIKAPNLKLSPRKCSLFQRRVQYLIHLVSKHRVGTDSERVAAERLANTHKLPWVVLLLVQVHEGLC